MIDVCMCVKFSLNNEHKERNCLFVYRISRFDAESKDLNMNKHLMRSFRFVHEIQLNLAIFVVEFRHFFHVCVWVARNKMCLCKSSVTQNGDPFELEIARFDAMATILPNTVFRFVA